MQQVCGTINANNPNAFDYNVLPYTVIAVRNNVLYGMNVTNNKIYKSTNYG